MTFAVDVREDDVVEWAVGGTVARRVHDYTPSVYVGGPTRALEDLRPRLDADPKVAATGVERWRTGLRAAEPEPVVRVDLHRVGEVRTLASEVKRLHADGYAPGTVRLYDVDLSPQFRYCLERDVDPTPSGDLTVSHLGIDEKPLADGDVTAVRVDGEALDDDPAGALDALQGRLERTDPDVLVFDDADLLPVLYERADEVGVDLRLGREPGWRRLAGASTYTSYGRVGHSPARYHVPGRAILNRANSFLLGETNLAGLRYLVRRSGKPLQECGWASIGNVLTAIQIRQAHDDGVLAPWRGRRAEFFKDARTLHDADRGGFTFDPEVGLHERVFEVDFSALYPNIMITRNVSPETVCCDCHPDREDVPGLGYSVCPETGGFVPGVLEPLVTDRDRWKAELAGADDEAAADLAAKREALKWILVSCFGYQGYRHSTFGRIEAHEAINAYAREILLTAKEAFERGGWRVLHGIVDSIWVTPVDPDAAPLSDLVEEVSDAVGIRLEREAEFAWVCFVPSRDGPGGALNRYFGRRADGTYKFRGIERRQRSTPPFVAGVQRELVEALDDHHAPEPVLDRLQRHRSELRAGAVPTEDLVVTTRTSKPPDAYDSRTRTVAALRRAREHGLDVRPGQDVRYVVVDDDARRNRERVRLHFEDVDGYDAEFYETRLVRAAESVVSPLGWDRDRIRAYLADGRDVGLSAFG